MILHTIMIWTNAFWGYVMALITCYLVPTIPLQKRNHISFWFWLVFYQTSRKILPLMEQEFKCAILQMTIYKHSEMKAVPFHSPHSQSSSADNIICYATCGQPFMWKRKIVDWWKTTSTEMVRLQMLQIMDFSSRNGGVLCGESRFPITHMPAIMVFPSISTRTWARHSEGEFRQRKCNTWQPFEISRVGLFGSSIVWKSPWLLV